MDKLVSVVLPTFNGQDGIEKAIQSVLRQTYKNIELIIVNDCSTDETAQIIEKQAKQDNRVIIISNKINMKLPMSLNEGFKKANGEYLTWTSDDNEYKLTAIEEMVNALEEDSTIDLIYTDYDVINQNGEKLFEEKKEEPETLLFYNCIGACFLYRKTLMKAIGTYDPELFCAEDYEYWIRAFLYGKLKHLDLNLYSYGVNEKSLTSTKQKMIARQTYNARMKHFDALLSRCKSYRDEVRFFDYFSLAHLEDNEKRKVKWKFYRKSKVYMAIEFKRNMKSFFNAIKQETISTMITL